jgi:hypothetical protein
MIHAQEKAIVVERNEPEAVAIRAELARLCGCGVGRKQRAGRDGCSIQRFGACEERIAPPQDDIGPIAVGDDNRIGTGGRNRFEREWRCRSRR